MCNICIVLFNYNNYIYLHLIYAFENKLFKTYNNNNNNNKKEFYGNFNKSRPLQRNLLILLHTNVYTNILIFFSFATFKFKKNVQILIK